MFLEIRRFVQESAICGAAPPPAGDIWWCGVFLRHNDLLLVKTKSKSRHLFYYQGGSEFSRNCLLICDVSFAQPQSG